MSNSKDTNRKIFCSLPTNIELLFRQGLEMTTSINLTSIIDQDISFKVKTNRNGFYLVEPIEGHIDSKQTISIIIKRKSITKQYFNQIQTIPSQGQQKFKIEFSSDDRKQKQVTYLPVIFTKADSRRIEQSIVQVYPENIDKKIHLRPHDKQSKSISAQMLQKQIAQKRYELQSLQQQKQSLLNGLSDPSKGNFTLRDLIYSTVFSFIIGYAFL